ncbi:MAG TPA: hypothetical protein PKW04_06865 [Novosphingobium sp.]|nr:hypothetical protein [Novosphingobium sp.]
MGAKEHAISTPSADKPRDTPAPDGEPTTDAGLAPEAHNESQDDEGEQAQSLAAEARSANALPYAASERGPASGAGDAAGSTPDVVDHIKQMLSDGRIDMSAYRGERNDDDVEGGLGPQGLEDDFPRGAE